MTQPAKYQSICLALEYARTLAVWTAISSGQVVVNGRNTVTNPISATEQFYRLSQESKESTCVSYQHVQKRLVRRVRARGLQDFLGNRHVL